MEREETDSLDEGVSIEVLDEGSDASNAALSTARECGTNGTSLALSILLQDLETRSEEIEESDDEGSKGDRSHAVGACALERGPSDGGTSRTVAAADSSVRDRRLCQRERSYK